MSEIYRPYTRGEWTVTHSGPDRKPTVVARRAGRPVTVATCDSGSREEDEANAAAISAVHDLVDALEDALNAIEWCQAEHPEDFSEADSEFQEKARAALKKAGAA